MNRTEKGTRSYLQNNIADLRFQGDSPDFCHGYKKTVLG